MNFTVTSVDGRHLTLTFAHEATPRRIDFRLTLDEALHLHQQLSRALQECLASQP